MDKNKENSQNLKSIIRSINRNIAISFLLILIFLFAISGIVFSNYKNYEEKIISQKLTATFSAFNTKTSEKLISLTSRNDFIHYLHSGWLSREQRYAQFLAIILYTNLRAVIGMNIYNNNKENIFSYGVETNDSITLDLCYLNRRSLNFDAGVCSYSWTLYFNKEDIIRELKIINPELVDCETCKNSLIINHSFGDFPVSKFSNMNIALTIKKSPLTILWRMLFFIVVLLSLLVTWNINRIKSVFKKYLYDPIIEITTKIKENDRLPNVTVEELSYLTQQIDQWKKQIMELEKLKAQEKVNEEKFKIMQSIGASIAHELRTPLRSIISGTSGIEKFFPILLDGYTQAKSAGLIEHNINSTQLALLRNVLTNLKIEGKSANTIIDMFLMKIRESIISTSVIKKLSMRQCINEALKRYVLQKQERDLVVFDASNDFQFYGDIILVEHIIFNLLKNALYYIARAKKGKIYIQLECSNNGNELHFKDTGMGIAKEILPNIFDRFYSKTEGGVGIGLSFCKMAMEWMDGTIACQSIEGEYTKFILWFPTAKEPQE